uniref:Uncharacterized protein n=1 Tax=Anguilla anguilla TaxID=7936 RepID=A0A0E9USA2_ANGAN
MPGKMVQSGSFHTFPTYQRVP